MLDLDRVKPTRALLGANETRTRLFFGSCFQLPSADQLDLGEGIFDLCICDEGYGPAGIEGCTCNQGDDKGDHGA